MERHHRQSQHLQGVRLGRGHTDFLACVDIQHSIGFAGDRAVLSVEHRDDARALALEIAQRHQRIAGLARLADAHTHGAGQHHRVAAGQLCGQLENARYAGQLLHQIAAHHTGMVGGSARAEDDLAHIADVLLGHVQAVELDGQVRAGEPPGQAVADDIRLLVDFLVHVVPVIALVLRIGGSRLRDDERLALHGLHLQVGQFDALGSEQRHLVIAEHVHPVGLVADRVHVGGDVLLTLADAYHQRQEAACGDQLVRAVGGHGCEGEPALHLFHSAAYGGP